MRKQSRRAAVALGFLLTTAVAAGSCAPWRAECSGAVFLRFRDAVASAESLDDVLPLLAGSTRKAHDVAAPEQRSAGLARLKQAAEHTEPKVDSARIVNDLCRIEVTAAAPSQRIEKGTYNFRGEGSAWKLVSWGWLDEHGNFPR